MELYRRATKRAPGKDGFHDGTVPGERPAKGERGSGEKEKEKEGRKRAEAPAKAGRGEGGGAAGGGARGECPKACMRRGWPRARQIRPPIPRLQIPPSALRPQNPPRALRPRRCCVAPLQLSGGSRARCPDCHRLMCLAPFFLFPNGRALCPPLRFLKSPHMRARFVWSGERSFCGVGDSRPRRLCKPLLLILRPHANKHVVRNPTLRHIYL